MKKDILIFGDSIAYGVGDPELGGWVDLFKREVWKKQLPYNVYNFCIDGNSTRDVLERLSIQSKQTLYQKKAILLAVGINDSVQLRDGDYFMSKEEFRRNFEKLVKQALCFCSDIYSRSHESRWRKNSSFYTLSNR